MVEFELSASLPVRGFPCPFSVIQYMDVLNPPEPDAKCNSAEVRGD